MRLPKSQGINTFYAHTMVLILFSQTPKNLSPSIAPNMNSSNPAPHWQAEPNTRETFNIISSCVGTLILCAWSAVHIDISKNKRDRIESKTMWFIAGLLAPELILFAAFFQWRRAGQLASLTSQSFAEIMNAKSAKRVYSSLGVLSRSLLLGSVCLHAK